MVDFLESWCKLRTLEFFCFEPFKVRLPALARLQRKSLIDSLSLCYDECKGLFDEVGIFSFKVVPKCPSRRRKSSDAM